jgi:hypothetical protein
MQSGKLMERRSPLSTYSNKSRAPLSQNPTYGLRRPWRLRWSDAPLLSTLSLLGPLVRAEWLQQDGSLVLCAIADRHTVDLVIDRFRELAKPGDTLELT